MVPSWTETLVLAGVNVVGRTRFCIHPFEEIQKIPAVGGTKDWDLKLVRSLQPDFILLDKEENTKEMLLEAPATCVITHIESVEDVSRDLISLSEKFKNQKLAEWALRWQKVAEKPVRKRSILEMPGIADWIKKPIHEDQKIIYIIWRKPWMAVSQNTFIGSQISHLGFKDQLISRQKKYFEFELEELPKDTVLLFSSEPFPFAKKKSELEKIEMSSAIINGEDYSWFGIRSLEFLEKYK